MDKMRVTIKNLGAVKKGEFELKPLTVFIGPNNGGKTWTAYAVASLFSDDMFDEYLKKYLEKISDDDYLNINDAVKQVLDKGIAKINLADYSYEQFTRLFNNVASILPTRLPYFLDSRRASFENLKVNIELDGLQDRFRTYIESIGLKTKLLVNKEGKALLNGQKNTKDTYLIIYTESSDDIQDVPVDLITHFITNCVLKIIRKTFFYNVVFFPPERTGMVPFLSKFSPKKEDKDSLEEDSSEDEKYSGISYPILSMFDLIMPENVENMQKRKEKAKNSKEIKKFRDIAKVLEDEIIGGNVECIKKQDGSSEIIFNLNGGSSYDIPITSSCVKDLVPLSFYLKYLASSTDLIVIDEPEMNLHPESQVKIVELLTSLVNLGLNIVITTHSTYLVDHIPNLTKAYRLNEEGKKGLEKKFKLKRKDSFIDQNKISVYLFDKGTIKNIYKKNGFIDWGTFSDISDYVSNLYFDLDEE
jgi:predicted ATPase